MVSQWNSSDSKSPQVSRTLLSLLADLNNAVVWIVSIHPPISKSSCPGTNPLVTVPNTPITIGIIVTFMFHSFFNSLARSRYLSFFSLSFNFTLWSAGTTKSTICQVLSFFVIRPRLSGPFVSQNTRGVCAFHSPEQILCCAYTICSHGQTLISCTSCNSEWITLPTQSYLALYSFCSNLLHSLIM